MMTILLVMDRVNSNQNLHALSLPAFYFLKWAGKFASSLALPARAKTKTECSHEELSPAAQGSLIQSAGYAVCRGVKPYCACFQRPYREPVHCAGCSGSAGPGLSGVDLLVDYLAPRLVLFLFHLHGPRSVWDRRRLVHRAGSNTLPRPAWLRCGSRGVAGPGAPGRAGRWKVRWTEPSSNGFQAGVETGHWPRVKVASGLAERFATVAGRQQYPGCFRGRRLAPGIGPCLRGHRRASAVRQTRHSCHWLQIG